MARQMEASWEPLTSALFELDLALAYEHLTQILTPAFGALASKQVDASRAFISSDHAGPPSHSVAV